MWEKNVTNLSDYFSENSEICQNYHHSRWLNFQKRIRFHKIFTKIGDKKKQKLEGIFCQQNWWYFRHLKTHQFLQITKIFTKIGDKETQNRVELLSPELVKFSSLKNSLISSNHQNFHQNWWQKKHKIGCNYCHQNWWNFRHLKTHQFHQITEIFTKIGDKKSTKLGAIIVTRIGEL